MKIRVGVVNTGWWADAMYMPALTANPHVEIVAVCGRNMERAWAFANRWGVLYAFNDYQAMVDSKLIDAVIVASHTDSHHAITMAALANGMHVLCEKPMAVNVAQAQEMTDAAAAKGVKTLIPFTYRYMPHARHIKNLIDEGYIGQPYHLNIRYYHDFGRNPGYGWGWNADTVGAGDLGNLASHCIYLALWYFGDVVSVSAELKQTIDRGTETPDGQPFTAGDDNGVITLRFANGAMGAIHYSSVAYETSAFKQQHFMEFHGSEGTLYNHNDWVDKQETIGARSGESLQSLELPAEIWGHANIANVHESYKAVFRKDLHMVGDWIDAIRNDTDVTPSFADGLAVQKVIAAAMISSAEGRRVSIDEIQ